MKDLNLIELTDLEKRYGKKEALTGINLTIGRGKIIGLLGPNGSGKTTLIKLLNGLLQPTSGEIKVNGKAPGVDSKKIISYLPDKMYFADWMKIADLMDFFEDFYEDFDRKKAEGMCETLKINTEAKVKSLSKGNKEKVQLVLVMCRKAQLYLLDEPIAGVDPAARDFILDTILNNYNEEGTVIISTHLIADIEKIMDEVIFIKEGNIVTYKSADDLREESGKSIDALFREISYRCIQRRGRSMLGKLIKYDLKALAKILAPLWGVLLVMGLIFGISIRSNLDGIGNTMIVFSLVVIVAVIVAIFVMNVIIVIQRFWNGLLQEEGYLMFTLPVTTRSLILSKVISALIISCGTALVISLLGVEIIAISPVKLMDTVTYFGNWVIKVHAGPWIGYGAVIAVVGLLSGIYHIYAAMVIGQLSNGNRFLFAFVAYAVLSIIVSLIGIPSMTNLDNMGSSLQNTFGFDSDLWIYLVENIVIIIIYHIVTEVILTKKLNLE